MTRAARRHPAAAARADLLVWSARWTETIQPGEDTAIETVAAWLQRVSEMKVLRISQAPAKRQRPTKAARPARAAQKPARRPSAREAATSQPWSILPEPAPIPDALIEQPSMALASPTHAEVASRIRPAPKPSKRVKPTAGSQADAG